ncbi:DinB family protein [Mongoliitalea daihaiensis]|uniref:DinB family protein n=1 Tax=Mongoliitalea daihaiensis TaxID=2782006 RepID=UPI001F1EF317|nr:DinB family protein [Mongoliitalea daihaiensis]UJP64292.1 DinB family protein [Mongoliitalea daihaiensis]
MNETMRPLTGEYHPYYQNYLDIVKDLNVLELIYTQIEEVFDIFKSKDKVWASTPYAHGKWSPKELLAHITDTDRVMAFRAFCFARGEHAILPGFDQDLYIAEGNFNLLTVEDLLADFAANRKAILQMIRTIRVDQYQARGIANGTEVSVRALIAIIPGHAAHHLRILKERYG